MTVNEFKAYVAAFCNRTVASFTDGSTDVLILAINDVKQEAEQEFDFAALKVDGYIVANSAGVELSTATTAIAGGGSAIDLKKITKLWLLGTTNGRYMEVPIQYDTVLERLLPSEESPPTSVRAYVRGTKLYVTGYSSNTNFIFEGVKWSAAYATGGAVDFFVDRYRGWFLLATLKRLNFYLKEDQRVVISHAALEEAWGRVQALENNLVPNYNLD